MMRVLRGRCRVRAQELGGHSSLLPHFGPTNTRIFLHFAVLLPTARSAASCEAPDDGRAAADQGESVDGDVDSADGDDVDDGSGEAGSGEGGRPAFGGAFLRVANETREWRRLGQMMLFDDSFEHAAYNRGAQPRVVLAIQLIHPDLAAGGSLVDGRWTYSRPAPRE